MALLRELEWIESNQVAEEYLICTKASRCKIHLSEWKDPDPWLKETKKTLYKIKSKIIILWLPSHCKVHRNDKADALANNGAKLNQDLVTVTHSIVKARIRPNKWTPDLRQEALPKDRD